MFAHPAHLLGSQLGMPEHLHDLIFTSLDEHDEGQINFPALCLRARHEVVFTGQQKLSARKPNAFGNRLLQDFETTYRQRTASHVRAHARVAVGEFADEEERRRLGIVYHHQDELQRLRHRYRKTEDIYDRLSLPRVPSSLVALHSSSSASLRGSQSLGSLATRSQISPGSPGSPGSQPMAPPSLASSPSWPPSLPPASPFSVAAVTPGQPVYSTAVSVNEDAPPSWLQGEPQQLRAISPATWAEQVRNVHGLRTPNFGAISRERVRTMAQNGVYLDVDSLRRSRG